MMRTRRSPVPNPQSPVPNPPTPSQTESKPWNSSSRNSGRSWQICATSSAARASSRAKTGAIPRVETPLRSIGARASQVDSPSMEINPDGGPPMRPNLAERAGRWSARHWKTATFGWLAFVAVAIALGSVLGTRSLTDTEQATGETARAEAILDKAGFPDHAGEAVLVQSKSQTVNSPRFQQTVRGVAAKLETLPTVRDVKSPLAHGREGQLSADRHSALVEFSISGSSDTADARVQPVLDEVAKLQKANPGFTVAEFGGASADHQVSKVIDKDLSRAEQLSVPITFLVLLFAFGAFVAAGIPVLLAFSGVLGSLGIAAALSHFFHASDATNSVMLLMGMAVGVDYSLFYLKREREERRNRSPEDALGRAAATSGRAVLISGGTVMIAMAGMLFA